VAPGRRLRQFTIASARAGHGATTIAGVLGLLWSVEVASHDPNSVRWLWPNLPIAPSAQATINDAGAVQNHLPDDCFNVVVLRGPCSLAILGLISVADEIDALILIYEPWRPLRREDIEHALQRKVDIEIPFSDRIPRLLDAGLLAPRVGDLEEFEGLRDWAADHSP
jgi:hypothetical protein